MKLHCGCGNVYLENYVNIDLYIEGYSFLAADRPDLVEMNRTTLENYYKLPYTKSNIKQDVFCAADRFMNMLHLDYPDDSIDEILCVQTFEHLSRQEAQEALLEWYRVLCSGGQVIIDIPDFEGLALKLLRQRNESDKEYYYRMIFGSQKNEYAFHKDGYSPAKLVLLLKKCGFVEVINLGNMLQHPYSSITIAGGKP